MATIVVTIISSIGIAVGITVEITTMNYKPIKLGKSLRKDIIMDGSAIKMATDLRLAPWLENKISSELWSSIWGQISSISNELNLRLGSYG